MTNDVELKTKVSEQLHDDVLIVARQKGFSSRSEYVRYLVTTDVYGSLSLLQVRPMPGIIPGPK